MRCTSCLDKKGLLTSGISRGEAGWPIRAHPSRNAPKATKICMLTSIQALMLKGSKVRSEPTHELEVWQTILDGEQPPLQRLWEVELMDVTTHQICSATRYGCTVPTVRSSSWARMKMYKAMSVPIGLVVFSSQLIFSLSWHFTITGLHFCCSTL